MHSLPPIASQNPARLENVRAPDADLRATARALEASFLAEMLKHGGLVKMKGAFSGGVGEEQFASFLRDEQARLMTQAGGIGLAETVFEALKTREANDGA